jgi:hypothetical protein
MRRHPRRFPIGTAVCVVASAVTLAGCSSGGGERPSSSAPQPSSSAQGADGGASGQRPIGVSPGGVTTKIDVPAQSTEEQYAQACLAAKQWMDSQGGDRTTLVEPFLKDVQNSTGSGPATFNTSWAQLSTAQQAAVIVAVQAASVGGCD